MLKYQVNINNFLNDTEQLFITNINCYQYYLSDSEVMDVVCTYNNNNINSGDNIIVQIQNPLNELTWEMFRYERKIKEVNKSDNTFTFESPRYIDLHVTSIEEVKEGAKNEANTQPFWWYFTFNEKHCFDETSSSNIKLIIEYYKEGQIKTQTLSSQFSVVSDTVLKYNININDKEKYGELTQILFDNTQEPTYGRGIANMSSVRYVKRDHYIITNSLENISILKYQIKMGVKLPLMNFNKTDLLNQYTINERFFDVESKKVINTASEMEKNIFVPVFKCGTTSQEIYKINFNLHLRHHSEDEEWKTTDNDYWNGIKVKENGDLEIDKNYFSVPYVDNEKVEWQSDNLYRLGFTNNDVKYQKSRLKKTFLRLSWYDSPNIMEQNLVGYSTVFIDSNRLFTCYTKNLKTENYKIYVSETNSSEAMSLTGIGVQRELGGFFKNIKLQDVENYRLSSQFSVQDRYSSLDCSDGFYIYLWKDYTQGTLPTDLYLHVDLNHARFGRSIPLMMPYFGPKNDEWDDKNKENIPDNITTWYDSNTQNGVKSFYDIVEDWQPKHGGYNMQRYLRYSYIHFKGCFDKDNNRYIYYLDEEQYGPNINNLFDDETNTLNLVLYEAKISNGQEVND